MFFLFFHAAQLACGILIPFTGSKPGPQAVEAFSPNHWIAREFPHSLNFYFERVYYSYQISFVVGCSKQLSSVILIFLRRLAMFYFNSSVPVVCFFWYSLFCLLSFMVLVFLQCLVSFFCALIFYSFWLWAALVRNV